MFRSLVIIGLAVLAATASHAGQPEAREVARLNNCPPKKIEVVQSLPGSGGKTIYKVACNLPKSSSTDKVADAVLIRCDQSLCELMRPLSSDEK